MTEQLKSIVQELNKPPFNRNFNLVSFDSLDPLQLVQVLSDVCSTIESKPSVDIRDEASEETALRLFTYLRVFKFVPPENAEELSAFRQGLIEGDKHVIYSILLWLFPRINELRTRAYLAKYLVRIEVPTEFLHDAEVEQFFAKCNQLMEEFKSVHRQSELIKADGLNSQDIRQDIVAMEQENDQLQKRVEKLKKKTTHATQKEKMLEVARNLRIEMQRESEIAHQKHDQRNALVHAEQKSNRLQQQINEVRQAADSLRPADVITKIEEENLTHAYLVNEKLPRELTGKRKAVGELQKVVEQPALDRQDINLLHAKINDVNTEINKLIELRDVRNDPTDDKLTVFRQQASMVANKKESAAETLQEARADLQNAEAELRGRKEQMRDSEGNEIITQTHFKNYVNKLRSKSTNYKRKRQEIQDLKAEIGVLARTEEILKQQAKKIVKTLEAVEEAVGTPRSSRSHRQANQISQPNDLLLFLEGKSPEEIQELVSNLNLRVEGRRSELATIIMELRPLREQLQRLSQDQKRAKSQYEQLTNSLESGYARLEQDVKSMRNEVHQSQSQILRLEVEKRILETKLEMADKEVGFGDMPDKSKSIRGQINAAIQRLEQSTREMQDEQSKLVDTQADNSKQIKMWRDLLRIMECKQRCWEQQSRITSAQKWLNNSNPSREGSSIDSQRTGSGRPGTSRGRSQIESLAL